MKKIQNKRIIRSHKLTKFDKAIGLRNSWILPGLVYSIINSHSSFRRREIITFKNCKFYFGYFSLSTALTDKKCFFLQFNNVADQKCPKFLENEKKFQKSMNITSETYIYINIIGMQLPFSFFPIYGRNIRIYQISKIFHPHGFLHGKIWFNIFTKTRKFNMPLISSIDRMNSSGSVKFKVYLQTENNRITKTVVCCFLFH